RRCLDESDLGQPVIRALSPDSLPVSAHLRRVSPGHLEVQPAYPRPGGGNTVTSVRSGDSAGTGGISAFCSNSVQKRTDSTRILSTISRISSPAGSQSLKAAAQPAATPS